MELRAVMAYSIRRCETAQALPLLQLAKINTKLSSTTRRRAAARAATRSSRVTRASLAASTRRCEIDQGARTGVAPR